MSEKLFCDICNCDITEEAHVSVRVLPSILRIKDDNTYSKVKSASWDWCISCAQKRRIYIEEE